MTNLTETMTFTVPLSFEAHELAQDCAAGLSNGTKTQQVYQNTLAVYAVDYYLRIMGFATDWPHSDSRDPIQRHVLDSADLNVPNIGTLECRPMMAGADHCDLPTEVQKGRTGYVIVELDAALKQATILGFTPVAATQIAVAQLATVDAMLAHLTNLEQPEPAVQPGFANGGTGAIVHELGNWLQERQQELAGWLPLNALFGEQLALATRFVELPEAVQAQRGKWLTVDGPDQPHRLALILAIYTDDQNQLTIQVKVRTAQADEFLPQHLSLALLSDTGERLDAIHARDQDNWMQLPRFRGQSSEQFQVQLSLGDQHITETFVI